VTLETFKLFADICSGTTIVVLALCLYRFRSRAKEVKLLVLIFLTSALVSASIDTKLIPLSSLNIPQNIYTLVLVGVSLVIYDVAWNRRYRILTMVSACSFGVFSMWSLLHGQLNEFHIYSLVFGGLIILVHSLVYFYDLLIKMPVQRLERLPMFWINTAFLFYFASSSFIFAAYAVDVFRDSLLLFWTIQNVLRFVHLIIIIVGLWQDLRNIRSRSSLASEQ
jgi:hypothetical protein